MKRLSLSRADVYHNVKQTRVLVCGARYNPVDPFDTPGSGITIAADPLTGDVYVFGPVAFLPIPGSQDVSASRHLEIHLLMSDRLTD